MLTHETKLVNTPTFDSVKTLTLEVTFNKEL